ncbi:hypothetical protein EXS74_01490 [Candidatus Woesearchaeota archaeon]|nr:hypothetical protein [Candidatus Woesearchaeota archaeon]
MVAFFSKSKKEQELTVSSITNTLLIEIDERNFDERERKNIPCIIKARDMITISGGTTPYVLSHGTIEEGYLQELRTEKGIQFSEQNISELLFTIALSFLLDLLEKGIKQTKMRIFVRDQSYKEKVTEVSVNLEHVQERMKKAEKIDCEGIILEVDEKKKIIVKFSPELAITTLHYSPRITLSFEDQLGIKNIELDTHYMAKEEKWGTYHFYTNTINTTFSNEENIRNKKSNQGKATLIIQSKGNIIIRNFTIDLGQIKRTLLRLETDKKDFRTFTEEDLITVHMTKKVDWKKIVESKVFGPRVMYATAWRPSIHLTLNHVVVPHGAAPEGWKDADTAILMPFKELKNLNEKVFYGGPTVDVSFFAYVKLPKSTKIIDRKEGEVWDEYVERINEKMREMGYKVIGGGEWGWDENQIEVCKWLTEISTKNNWPTTAPHFYTPIGKIENQIAAEKFDGILIRDMNPTQGNKLFRKVLLKRIEEWEPNLWQKYGIHFRAWSNFWEKKLK